MARRGSHIELKLKLEGLGQKEPIFLGFDREREKKRERGEPGLPPKIYGIPLVGFRRAKNKSSLHRRGVCVGT